MSNPIHDRQPATKPAIRSKHRLADIGHHFLSNPDQRLPAWENTTVIPVLLGTKNDDYVVYELNRAFNRQNSSSMVLNIENRLAVSNQLSSLAGEMDLHEDASLPDYCLIPASSPSTTLALQSDRLIIAVHASLGGVRIAYDQLAFMASLDTDFNVCVIMLGAKTRATAKRFFGFLCDNAQSLLSLKLECGGYLLQDSEQSEGHDVEEAEMEEADIATDFDGMASGLLRHFSPRLQREAPVTRLAAPHGPAALLRNL
ncbi:MAG TPA: hypothetical protein ENI97_08815 [Gammaproteobacteria bacterium]|nr:hypothetical protein [Gammaproteobacteria bacterium]